MIHEVVAEVGCRAMHGIRRAGHDFGIVDFIGHHQEYRPHVRLAGTIACGPSLTTEGASCAVDGTVGGIPRQSLGEGISIVTFPNTEGQSNLLEVARAIDAHGLGFRFGKGRQQQAGQNGDDRDND